MPKTSCFNLVAALVVVCGSVHLSAVARSSRANSQSTQQEPSSAGAQAVAGRSETLIPNGRILLLGGDGNGSVLNTAWLRDPGSQALQQIAGHLRMARDWHTATLLPDGTVLVFGGAGTNGSVVSVAEIFDPTFAAVTQTLQTGLTVRSRHTATLLTDGRVMVIGGLDSSGNVVDKIELWDFRSHQVSAFPAQLRTPRSGHTASLQADGTVLVWGGVDANGTPLSYGEVVDPVSATVRTQANASTSQDSGQAAAMVASVPEDGATDVPLNGLVSFRFSAPLSVTSVTSATIILTTNGVAVPAKVVPAEGGMLAFLTPQAPLLPGTTYTATLSGLIDISGQPVPPAEASFTTLGVSATNTTSSGVSTNATGNNSSNNLPPLQAPAGVTALAGRVVIVNGTPLPHVSIEIGSHRTFTDSTGRFLLQGLSPGHQVMIVDGATANTKDAIWGLYRIGVELQPARTTALTYTIWETPLDTKHIVHFPSPTTSDLLVTNPDIPGMEVRIPANTIITDARGHVVTSLGITPIPLNKPPFPFKRGIAFPVYFTIQPSGASFNTAGPAWSGSGTTQPKGVQIYYQNYPNAKSGTRFDFWNYDPFKKGWYVYGKGRVSSDKHAIVPEAGTQIWTFDGAMVSNPSNAPPTGPKQCSECDGDPVDLETGLFVETANDLSLPGTPSLDITRVYRPDDAASRAFGIGANISYNIFMVGDNSSFPEGYTYQDLILPDGGRIHFLRTSPCDSNGYCTYSNAVYMATSAPSDWYGASLVFQSGDKWVVTKRDGTVYVFPDSDNDTDYRQATPLSITDRYGNSLTFTRDGFYNLLQVTGSNGRWIHFSYDGIGRITQANDSAGRTVSYAYDGAGRLASFTDANGGITYYSYDDNDNMVQIQKPDGNLQVTNTYDESNRVVQQTHPDGGTYQFSYVTDGNGNITQTRVTDPSGSIRQVQFNSDGYSTSDTRGLGTPQQETITYQRQPDSGLFLSVTDALGRQTAYSYDALAEVTSVTQLANTPQAVTTLMSYPPLQSGNYILTSPSFAQPITVTDPLGNTTQFAYDNLGNLLNIVDPIGNVTAMTYNSAGQIVTRMDPLGNTTRFGYLIGDLVSIIDPLSRTTNRFVDAGGRLVSVTDPAGKITRYAYTPLNQISTVTDPLGAQTSFTYYPNGPLHTVTDANQNTTTYTYDSMDRLHSRQDPLGNLETYQYDKHSRVVSYVDRRGTTTNYSYDSLGRRTFSGFGFNGSSYDSTINYTFDGGNRLWQTVDSLNGTITRSFDGLDGLLSEVSPQGTVSYTYDADERRHKMTVAGQPTVYYTFDPNSRLAQITQNGNSVGFNYDSASRRTSLALPNGVLVGYGYDQASELTAIQYQLGSAALGNVSYSYDLDGHRTAVTGSFARTNLPNPVTGAQYNVNNQLTQWGSVSPAYDNNGNLLNDSINSYSWNSRNQLASMNNGTDAFAYDSFGRRIAKGIAGTGKSFVYDGANVVQELQGTNPTAYLLTGGIDEIFQRTDSSGTWDLLADALGSTLAISDNTGTIQTQYSYEPFGNTIATGASSTNVNEFTGRELDETGLYFYRARYYNPQIGRFVSEDPIGIHGGINVYRYADNDPVDFGDPTGKDTYVCTAPLHAFGPVFGPLAYYTLPFVGIPTYHEYLCVSDGTTTICNGQDRSGGPFGDPGQPSDDTAGERGGGCSDVNDQLCVDQCVTKVINDRNRPGYDLLNGWPNRNKGKNCQKWTDTTLQNCVQQCIGKE